MVGVRKKLELVCEAFFYIFKRKSLIVGENMAVKAAERNPQKIPFTKRMQNGRLMLMPTNEAVDTVEKITPAFKKIAENMIKNRFEGTLS